MKNKKKKGYHYTSKTNWEGIQKSGGMTPYLIQKPEAEGYFPKGINGIWLWKEDPKGASHAGNIMYQVAKKGNPEIVKLEIEYSPDQLVRFGEKGVQFQHSGNVEKWEYHKSDIGVIHEKSILLQNIRVVGNYNTVQRLK
jgi:hypothetical protein